MFEIERVAAGLIVVDGQSWALASTVNRKPAKCMICRNTFAAGSGLFYRPIGNSKNRLLRLCQSCVEEK